MRTERATTPTNARTMLRIHATPILVQMMAATLMGMRTATTQIRALEIVATRAAPQTAVIRTVMGNVITLTPVLTMRRTVAVQGITRTAMRTVKTQTHAPATRSTAAQAAATWTPTHTATTQIRARETATTPAVMPATQTPMVHQIVPTAALMILPRPVPAPADAVSLRTHASTTAVA